MQENVKPQAAMGIHVSRRILFWILLVGVPVVEVHAGTATQPAGETIQTITFAIPGSRADTTSKAIVALPADYAKPQA